MQNLWNFELTTQNLQSMILHMASYSPKQNVLKIPGITAGLIKSLRPKQWTKNLIVYFALFFTINETWNASDMSDLIDMFIKASVTFLLFCVLSSGIYIINDLFDAESDRHHPIKKMRPIASGKLPIFIAWPVSIIMIFIGISMSFYLNHSLMFVSVIYVLSSILYSSIFRHVFILDVMLISTGFILRAVAGAVVLSVPISPWLYACTGLGALLIALCKRKSELLNSANINFVQRKTLSQYKTSLLDMFISIVAPSTLITYTLYTFTSPNLPSNHAMILTVPIVIYGLFRYLYLVHVRHEGENPEDILVSDVPLMLSILFWLIISTLILIMFRSNIQI